MGSDTIFEYLVLDRKQLADLYRYGLDSSVPALTGRFASPADPHWKDLFWVLRVFPRRQRTGPRRCSSDRLVRPAGKPGDAPLSKRYSTMERNRCRGETRIDR